MSSSSDSSRNNKLTCHHSQLTILSHKADNCTASKERKRNTGSRLFIEVKPCWTGLICGWVTIWTDLMCCTLWEVRLAWWTSITPSTSTTNAVGGLCFSRSQPDLEGFLRALRFPPFSRSIHLAVVLCSEVIHGSCSGAERLAGCTAPSIRPR